MKSAKIVKIVSSISMCVGIVFAGSGNMIGAPLLIVGFFGFVVGRFME